MRLSFARAGLGSALVPRSLVAHDLATGRLVAEEAGPGLHLGLRYDPARLTKAAATLCHHLTMASRDVQWADEAVNAAP